jgi:hypothetical protein
LTSAKSLRWSTAIQPVSPVGANSITYDFRWHQPGRSWADLMK